MQYYDLPNYERAGGGSVTAGAGDANSGAIIPNMFLLTAFHLRLPKQAMKPGKENVNAHLT